MNINKSLHGGISIFYENSYLKLKFLCEMMTMDTLKFKAIYLIISSNLMSNPSTLSVQGNAFREILLN